MNRPMLRAAALSAVASLGLASAAQAELIYGMTAANSLSTSPGLGLVSFDSATPGTINTIGAFTGVVAGQSVRSIDFRPATGELWALSTGTAGAAQLYTVDLGTAALTPVGAGLTLTGATSVVAEMDFNPAVDRIRIVTSNTAGSNNFRANPNDGALVAVDSTLAPATLVIGAAYSNNVPGAPGGTTLYAWDYTNDALVTIGGINGTPSPNLGAVTNVNVPAGFLTFNAGFGMDISGATNTLYATRDNPVNGASMNLITRNLTTGAITPLGDYPAGVFISDISVVVPEPTTLGLAGVAAMGLLRRRRA